MRPLIRKGGSLHKTIKDEFEQLPLRAHSLLADVPLRWLFRLDLPGGRVGMSLQDIAAITGFGGDGEMEAVWVTKLAWHE